MHQAPDSVGRVHSVALNPNKGVPKLVQPLVTIGPMGVEGDYHAGPYNKHASKPDPSKPNLRQLTVISKEVLDEMNASLGTRLKPGDLGENVLLEGHGDLGRLRDGDLIALGDNAVLRVTAQNDPCSKIGGSHPQLVKCLMGKRGVTAVVVSTGVVRPGDPARITQRQESRV